MAALTDDQAGLFLGANYAVVATLRPDGSPQQTVVWVDWDGEHVVFNTQLGRRKPDYLERDPRASVLVIDGDDFYRWVAVSGPVETTEEGAAEHINALSWKYRGRDYDLEPEDRRLIVRVTPQYVTAHV